MGFSRSARIKTLLAIDTAFFFLEIIVGYSVGSLALVADSFHMLNDVMSLIVALYALNLAESGTRSNKYSYGWQRAEILGALVNGVFLLALCFSIFLEAIQRMFGAPEVSSPKLVVIVGSMGLASNIVGLFLFHEHGHSHGGGGHDHGHSHGPKQVKDASAAAEEGHSHAVTSKKSKVNGSAGSHSHGASSERTPLLQHSATAPQASPKPVTGTSGTETPFEDEEGGTDAIEDLLVHPARTREAIVRQAYDAGFGSPRDTSGLGHRRTLSVPSQQQRQRSSSAGAEGAKSADSSASASGHVHTHDHASGDGHLHEHEDDHEHDHDHGDEDGDDHHGHSHGGHSHGNMNMRGVFLHVLGDALGNVGVIAAGLVIWLTKSPYRFYSDPLISFIITCIIFSSALPLVRSASFILLQGTPSHVPLEKVKSAILRIPNVISVHDLHIWSLSESKLVASMHILVKSHEEFTQCSNDVRKLLHRFGVHSSTIQPELLDGNGQTKAASVLMASRNASVEGLVPGELELDDGNCTVQCVDDSCVDSACCPPAVIQTQKSAQSLRPASQHDHDHSH